VDVFAHDWKTLRLERDGAVAAFLEKRDPDFKGD